MSSFTERLTIAKNLRSRPQVASRVREQQAKNWLSNTYPILVQPHLKRDGYYSMWLYQESRSLQYLSDAWVQEKRAIKAERLLADVQKSLKRLLTFANDGV